MMLPNVSRLEFHWPPHVVSQRTTFANVRKHIMGCLNVSRFDLAFRVFAATNDPQTGSYGEFNIILNYAWYHERDEVATQRACMHACMLECEFCAVRCQRSGNFR